MPPIILLKSAFLLSYFIKLRRCSHGSPTFLLQNHVSVASMSKLSSFHYYIAWMILHEFNLRIDQFVLERNSDGQVLNSQYEIRTRICYPLTSVLKREVAIPYTRNSDRKDFRTYKICFYNT